MSAALARAAYADLARSVITRTTTAERLDRQRQRAETLLAALPASAPQPLPELDGHTTTPARLREATQGYRRPVVVRGAAQGIPALSRWSRASLRAALGEHRCTAVTVTPGELAVPLQQLRFAEFLDRMDRERLYLNNTTDLYAACPALLDDLDLPGLQHRLLGPRGFFDQLFVAQLFVGGPHVYSRLHHAPAGNLFVQIAGRKRWILAEPRYTPHLLPVPARPFQFSRSGLGSFRQNRELGRPDGLLARLPRHEVVLEPGDVLYNAPWWWHEVENLDAFTVASAARHVPPPPALSPSWRNHALLTALSIYAWGRPLALAVDAARKLLGAREPLMTHLNRRISRSLLRSFSQGALSRED